jgi:hypothetical protein
MITLMLSFLFGTLLGQRFKVVVLVPAMAPVLILSITAGITQPNAAWEIIKIATSMAVFLQCGYLAGIAIRYFLAAAPARGSSSLVSVEASTNHPGG